MLLLEPGCRVGMRLLSSVPGLRSRAQSTVEYALVGALVVIAAAGALTLLGTEFSTVFNNLTNALKGH